MIKTHTQAIEIIKLLGVSTEIIAKLSSDKDEAADVNPTEVKDLVFAQHRTALATDDAFLGPIREAVRGQVLGAKQNKLLQAFESFGVTKAEFDSLPDKTKFDDLIALCASRASEKTSKGDNKEEIIRLNRELAAEKEAKKKLEEETIPALQSQNESERQVERVHSEIRKQFDKNAERLIGEPDLLFPAIQARMSEHYDYRLDGGKIQVLKKGADTPAYDSTNKVVEFESLLEITLKEAKALKLSNAVASTKKVFQENGTPKFQPVGLQRAKETAAAQAAAR